MQSRWCRFNRLGPPSCNGNGKFFGGVGLFSIFTMSRTITSKQLFHYYTAVIRVLVSYCAPVWHYALTKCQTQQLEAIQKRSIQIVEGCRILINALCCAFERASQSYIEKISLVNYAWHGQVYFMSSPSSTIYQTQSYHLIIL